MTYDIKEYEGNFCMHCRTLEEARTFLRYLHSVGRKWISGDPMCPFFAGTAEIGQGDMVYCGSKIISTHLLTVLTMRVIVQVLYEIYNKCNVSSDKEVLL